MAFAKVLRNTNVANLIVWSYWWPLIILATIFLGRVWCTVCPIELVTSLASKVGLKRKPPAFLRSGWVMVIFYTLIIFVGIHTLSIHRDRTPVLPQHFLRPCLSGWAPAGGLFEARAHGLGRGRQFDLLQLQGSVMRLKKNRL
jgi:hypothetical protein